MTADLPTVAVLDTNVVVSALLSPSGPPARIIASIGRKAFITAYDARIIGEYRAVLLRPRFGFHKADVEHFIEQFMEHGWAIEPTPWAAAMTEESDRIFIEAAKAASATLVTGNLRHFPDEPWVMSLAAFWAKLATNTLS